MAEALLDWNVNVMFGLADNNDLHLPSVCNDQSSLHASDEDNNNTEQ
ncbi:MAG TPA: hypothetical protein VKA09_11290 [Nitrososphaeraceae archaeon]|nr:hypothetical protein [Nitrososphaeraceae archaeon]